ALCSVFYLSSRRRHTISKRDWSSDVCSSDLPRINILVAWIMMRGGDVEENLNMRGAYLHVISDMLGSIGAIAAALLSMFFGWGRSEERRVGKECRCLG